MGAYFEKMKEMENSLINEAKNLGIEFSEADDNDTIEIPKDSLTDEQKKDILKDKGVDKAVVDNMKSQDEIDGALDATLNNDDVVKENSNGFVVEMNDDDLELHGYVKEGDEKFELTEDEKDAIVFENEDDAKSAIKKICDKNHYDINTFSVTEKKNNEDDLIMEDAHWVAIDPMNPSATVLGD